MKSSGIEAKIRGFIRDEFLGGQDAGLLPTTPLLELRILESFELFRLVAYLNEVYRVDIGPDEISGKHFRNIECIASLVSAKMGDMLTTEPFPIECSLPEGVAVFEAPSCSQVFVVFSGLGRDSPEFFNAAGIGDRNIVLFHDASSQSYRHGISPHLPSPVAICDWVQTWIDEHAYVQEVYCLGVSAGGPMAMIAGNRLNAKTVWALAPRTTRLNIVKTTLDDLAILVERATGKKVSELEIAMTQDDQDRIDGILTPSILDEYYRNLLDPARFLDLEYLDQCVATLKKWNGVTEHRIYYVQRDTCDAQVAESLKYCPGVNLLPVNPSDPPPAKWAFSRWIPPMWWLCRDHLIVELLHQREELQRLFPEFSAVGANNHNVRSKSIA
jgi:clorobiocin biosynthesis protein CloN5